MTIAPINIPLDYYSEVVALENFSSAEYVAQKFKDHPERIELLNYPEGRKLLTKDDPLLFALLYLQHHLKLDGADTINFSIFHIEVYEWARNALRGSKTEMEERHCFVAPRSSGKSTLMYLILPLWALAHKHRKYTIAIADTASQAETHLRTLKGELDSNQLLRTDFESLCTPRTNSKGMTEKDTQTMYVAKSGIVFQAAGITTGVRGSKVGNQRPDLVIGDDIEPGEANYSAYQANGRLKTLKEDIFQLNLNAVVALVGTVTMYRSIIHQILMSVTEKEAPGWVTDNNIKCHYYPAIIKDSNGDECSLWESKWSFEGYITKQRHTAEFQKEMMNNPRATGGDFWSDSDFVYEDIPHLTDYVLFVDPAVTTKGTSDDTGLAVVARDPVSRKVVVVEALGVKLEGEKLRLKVISILERYPEIKGIMVESNQGGNLWLTIFHGMPVPVKTQHTKMNKEAKFAQCLTWYQRGLVVHRETFPDLEGQMISFGKAKHDDIADAVVMGIGLFLLPRPLKQQRTPTAISYV